MSPEHYRTVKISGLEIQTSLDLSFGLDSVNCALCNHTISGTGLMASLNSLLQGELRNEVPEAVLRQCIQKLSSC